jgi:DNA (cytosine-5)-methyltransferase 1
MAWDDFAPTITGGCINPSKGRFLHPTRNRPISVLEAARLQAFPIWYKFTASHGRYPIAEMIGEALPPRFAAAAAKHIARHLVRDIPASQTQGGRNRAKQRLSR